MVSKKKALAINILATILYACALIVWFFFSLMGIMSIANVESFFEVIVFIYIFLLLLLPNIIVSQFMSWRSFVKGFYSKSYKWLIPPLVHIILFIVIFNISLFFE